MLGGEQIRVQQLHQLYWSCREGQGYGTCTDGVRQNDKSEGGRGREIGTGVGRM